MAVRRFPPPWSVEQRALAARARHPEQLDTPPLARQGNNGVNESPPVFENRIRGRSPRTGECTSSWCQITLTHADMPVVVVVAGRGLFQNMRGQIRAA